jgi:hypothetical protein
MIRDILEFQPKPLKGIKEWDDFYNKLKTYYNQYTDRIDKGLKNLFLPDLTEQPSFLASEWDMIFGYDSYDDLRKRLAETPSANRMPLALASWKPFIDTITGGDCEVWTGQILGKNFVFNESLFSFTDTWTDNSSIVPNESGMVWGAGVWNEDTFAGQSDTGFDPSFLVDAPSEYIVIDLGIITALTESQRTKMKILTSRLKNTFRPIVFGKQETNGMYNYLLIDQGL